MTASPSLVAAEEIKRFILSVLDRWGTPPAIADLTADLMVQTDLRGVDSHGVGMLPRYLEWYRAGFIRPAAEPRVERDEGPTALIDANQAFGHYASTLAMELCLAKARAHGVGFAAVHNSNHFGAAANYSMMALRHDMVGISMTNGPWASVVPTFGRQALLATNPLSVAVPGGTGAPYVLDMATSTVAIGKLSVASRWARPIPEGWALDAEGQPTTDPTVALASRLLTPLGGTREGGSHKGYGLAVMVEILAGVLSGAVYPEAQRRNPAEASRANVGHFFGAIDIARFRPIETFKADIDDLLQMLRNAPRVDGQERIYVAGEPEWECAERRRREGVPLAPGLVAQLRHVAAETGVPFTLDAAAGARERA